MRSDQIKKGVERAPNRSLLYALGLTEEEMNRPLVGIVSSWNEIVPGHCRVRRHRHGPRGYEVFSGDP